MTYPNTTGTGNAEILDTGIARLAINAVVVTSVMTALALVLAFTRFTIRMRAGWGIDDTVLAVSLIFLIIQLIAQFFRELAHYYHLVGYGRYLMWLVHSRLVLERREAVFKNRY